MSESAICGVVEKKSENMEKKINLRAIVILISELGPC